jgi:hypothetical protein
MHHCSYVYTVKSISSTKDHDTTGTMESTRCCILFIQLLMAKLHVHYKFTGLLENATLICRIFFFFLTLSIVYISIKLQRWASLRLGPGLRLAQPGVPTARISVLSILPEDGRRSSFRNVVILLKYRRWTKSKKPLLHIITRHRQNSLDFNDTNCKG